MMRIAECPDCGSINKPGSTYCRVCGKRFNETRRASVAAMPVVLERVMSGEVFTAILGRRPGAEADIAGSGADPGARAISDEGREDYRRALEDVENSLREKAAEVRERVETYRPSRRAKAATEASRRRAVEDLHAAVEAMEERRFEDAIACLRRAIDRNADDPRGWVLLGEVSMMAGRPFEAAAAYAAALTINPCYETGWLGMAKVLRATGDLPRALSGTERALAINPRMREAWNERGIISEALQAPVEALRSFEKVLELRPGDPAARAKYSELKHRSDTDAVGARTADSVLPPTERDLASSRERDAGGASKADDEAVAGGIGSVPIHSRQTPTRTPSAPLAGRVRTYVDGLDEVMNGGIPQGHVVLVQGAPGTMKSSLAYSILLQNAVHAKHRGLFLSLEERKDSILQQIQSLGLDVDVASGSLVLLDVRLASELLREGGTDWISSFEGTLQRIREERGFDLLVIDSLDALEALARFKERRREIFRLFEWIRDLGVTSLLITERPDWHIAGHVLQGRWEEDFLADGMIQLRMHSVSELEIQRRLRVIKMRGTKHEAGYFALLFEDGRFRVTQALSP